MGGGYLPPSLVAAMKGLLLQGMSIRVVCKELNVSPGTVVKYRKKFFPDGFDVKCPCGKNASHTATCSFRKENLPKIHAKLEQLDATRRRASAPARAWEGLQPDPYSRAPQPMRRGARKPSKEQIDAVRKKELDLIENHMREKGVTKCTSAAVLPIHNGTGMILTNEEVKQRLNSIVVKDLSDGFRHYPPIPTIKQPHPRPTPVPPPSHPRPLFKIRNKVELYFESE